MDMKAPTPGQDLLIPLSALRPSRRNVRKSGGTPVEQLARSIERIGLLHNLVVTDSGDGQHYEVEAGGRRLQALQWLAKRKRLDKTHQVRCLLVPDASAKTVSLAENVARDNLSPIDELLAWKSLADDGHSIEDIAADFGVTPLVVQRRLRLANVSPRLLADHGKELVTLDQLMALAITDDHLAQEAAFYDAPEWQRSARDLRTRLTAQEVDAAHDAIARFVGLEAYEAAGGGVRRDLFADAGQGVYLTDRPLLDKLAADRLAEVAAQVQTEEWAWIEVVPRVAPSDLYAFQRVRSTRREPTRKEAQALAKLEKRIEAIDMLLQEEDGVTDEAEAQALQEEGSRLSAELEAKEQELAEYSQKARTLAGVLVTVNAGGAAIVHRGLVREADAKRAKAAKDGVESPDPDGAYRERDPNASVSEKLARQLSAHRTAAIQAELSRQPGVALAALVHRLVLQAFYDQQRSDSPLLVDCAVQDKLERFAPDLSDSPAAAALIEVRQAWQAKLPAEPDGLLAALLALPQEELLSLLAACAACCIDAVSPQEMDAKANDLAAALDLDMTRWWTPTAAGYFAQVSKARIFEAIGDFAPEHVKQLELAKKPELAARAEQLAAGKGWLPAMLRKPA
ncbi:MAG: ParB/RepB/Spo0J family partition protein [Nevskia sp.]|nr:ParB/RepB/Spo0J family partition protein [Nevskia sp.]